MLYNELYYNKGIIVFIINELRNIAKNWHGQKLEKKNPEIISHI